MDRALVSLPIAMGIVLLLGCAQSSAFYTGPGKPTARPDTALVEVFLKDQKPSRAFVVLGEVEATTETWVSFEGLLERAKTKARKLGGDAIINVESDTTPTVEQNVATGRIYTGTRKKVRGTVVAWTPAAAATASPPTGE